MTMPPVQPFEQGRARDTRIWGRDEQALVVELIEAGLSASKIGDRLGLTRNQVIGRIHRLPKLRAKFHKPPSGRPPRVPKPVIIEKLAVSRPPRLVKSKQCVGGAEAARQSHKLEVAGSSPAPATNQQPPRKKRTRRPKPLMNLKPCQCRWPVEDAPQVTGGFLFCAAATAAGASYCGEHRERARG